MDTLPVVLESAEDFSLGAQDEAGFFDDDMMSRGAGGRGDIRSHLDDLAQRHPEFASQLRGPAWGEEMWAGDGEAAAGSAGASNSDPRQEQERCEVERGRQRNANLPQHGLRNTVPDMGQRRADELKEEARGQRSWSAPPDSRQQPQQQRFVSRININPVNPEEGDGDTGRQAQAPDNQGKPPPVPKQPQPPQQPKSAGNVRHIPIFVEGRDEPILPKNVDADTEHSSQFTSQAQHQFHPQNKPFPQQKRPFQSPQNNPPPQHTKQPNRSFNTSPRPFQHQPEPGMQPQPADERPKTPEAPRPAPPRVPNDPISRVQAIQKEVAALREQVDKYSGSSRQEKEYVYLDEMLTRNLIKLDDIETEGKENIRVARKDAIRCIQQCISLLEGKVPVPQGAESAVDAGDSEETMPPPSPPPSTELAAAPSPMDMDSAAPTPKTDNEELQQPKD